MSYEILWSETAVKLLEKLDKKLQKRIIEKLESITENPFAFVKKLVGLPLYRLRVGDYRIILSIEAKKLIIFILELGHRKMVYK
ncbi:MAG: type II toxin-antitoxin system RelE/ParE family toxin [Candidatus Altiarchaeota archaeon]|nr:type II toxin-antitoxin system RelE/ParE family toxin [Candidatus Altiarchaeota archaeon]